MQQIQLGNSEYKNNIHSKYKKETIMYQLNPTSQLLLEDVLKLFLNKFRGIKFWTMQSLIMKVLKEVIKKPYHQQLLLD